jgi:DNA polymerase III epsilon subunit-like protein
MKFICIDTETSGLDPRTCEIVELSYQPWENFQRGTMTSETFTAVGNTDHPDFAAAAKINGYDPATRRVAALRAPHLVALFAAIDAADGVAVGNNVAFHWSFIRTAAERMRVPLPKFVRLIDVASMAVPMVAAGKVGGFSLRELATLTGKLDGPNKVTTTIDVFEHLCRAYVKALVAP